MKNEKMNEMNQISLATRLSKEDAQAFRELAHSRNMTVSKMLSDYIKTALHGEQTREANPTAGNVAILTTKNVERLKAEVAHHNPNNLNPDRMLNHILNVYFSLADEIRK